MEENEIRRALVGICGENGVFSSKEAKYIYSRIPAGFRVGEVDYLALPKDTKQVQRIVQLASTAAMPLVPAGAGLSLADLTVPLHGGIVLDLRRMDRILQVNDTDRYAIIEAGVTVGQMMGYLSRRHPSLRISVPDAPPSATICGNLLIYGSGHLSRYGPHSDMINEMEVVLSNGEATTLTSGAVGLDWYTRIPRPDLTNLFTYWFGTTGIVTKLSVKLYPKHKARGMAIFKVESPDDIPGIIRYATTSGLAEDVLFFAMIQKESRLPMTLLHLFLTGEDNEEVEEKKTVFREMFSDWTRRGRSVLPVDQSLLPEKYVSQQLMEPKYGIDDAVDAKKGGGCGYIGGNFPIDSIPAFYKEGLAIAQNYGFFGPLYTIRNVGMGHSVIYNIMYPFNRADPESIALTQKAMSEATDAIGRLGGIEWKAPYETQRKHLSLMPPGTRDLMGRIQNIMNPQRIFNRGNWEMDEEVIK